MTDPVSRDRPWRRFLSRFRDDRSGATAIEYALIGVMIFLVIVVGIQSYGQSMNGLYSSIATKIAAAN